MIAIRSAALIALAGLAACLDAPDVDTSTGAPLVGVDGSVDSADRSCNVVLRELARPRNGTGGYETAGSSWVWNGAVDISAAAAAEGLVPSMLYQYGSDPTWYEAIGTTSAVTAPAGFARFDIRLDAHLPGPGMSGTSLSTAKVQMVPFLRLAGGGRLFDHNRNSDDLASYVIDASGDFQVRASTAVCPAVTTTPTARLIFAPDFSETQNGGISPGRALRVEYDARRLTACRNSQNGHDLWDIGAHVRWLPSGATELASVHSGAATFAVPLDARGVEIWFENTASQGCQAWDSNMGANYRYDVLAPPSWLGDARVLITRDTSDPCNGAPALGGFNFETWARQRAAMTNLCFRAWQPGVTDHDDPNLWQKLDARIVWRARGSSEPWREVTAPLDRRVGNDARWAVSLRSIDPFRSYHCPEIPTTITATGYAHAEIEWYAIVNGAELRPAAGAAYPGTFEDYANDAYRAANCH
ncbi:MAG: DUF6209 family protein [Deltaproteobacteria bacterium]|nr:DUF6209 family protein [Deltaproteobacteria bacterium]